MPAVPAAVQNLIDSIDGVITKERSPLVNVLLASPLFILVSLPIAFIVAAVVFIITATEAPMVAQGDNTTFGIAAFVLMVVVFWAWASYGTYTTSKAT